MKSKNPKPVAPTQAFYQMLFAKNYVTMQYYLIQMISEHWADVSRVFGADLQSALVLAIIGQKSLDAHLRAKFLSEGKAPPNIVPPNALGVNSSSIAQISGIPRETVRRKIRALTERGWIERDERGCYSVVTDGEGSKARRDLADLDQRSIERVSRFLAATQRVAARALADAEGAASSSAPDVLPLED